jgi:fructose-bisphosphate aldolase class II
MPGRCREAVRHRARFYFVFHGGSGSTQEEIHEAIDYGVIKMNVDTDMQYAFTRPSLITCSELRWCVKVEGEVGRKKDYDPRTYLGLAEAAMAARVKQAVTDLRGNGKTMFKQ